MPPTNLYVYREDKRGTVFMVAVGDTNQSAVLAWLWQQAEHITSSKLLILAFLSTHAFYREANPEQVPVGQVLYGYSGVPDVCAGTGLGRTTIERLMWSLQAEHGYLRRVPRVLDNRPVPYVIRLYWTEEFDVLRAAVREGQELPEVFRIPAGEVKSRERLRSPGFQLIQGGLDEVSFNN